jgi:cytochrome b
MARAARRADDASRGERKILVWDAPTRLFHWLSAVLVAAAYGTWRLNWMDWHARVGDALLGLVLFRLLWGFFGSETACFSRFLASPGAAAHHLVRVFRREPDRQIGHNPAGGWMVLLLLALLLAETLTGLYVANDVADEGPLTGLVPARIADLITTLHSIFWQALLAAVTLHVLAVIVYGVAKRHNLLSPMITGRKSLPPSAPQPSIAGSARGLLLLGCSALAAAALINFL